MEAKESKISQIEEIEYDDYVYDIHMDNTPHTFFANDILVHNSEFVLKNNKTDEEIRKWVDNFNNNELTKFVQKYNTGELEKIEDYLTLEIEYEKDMERIFFGWDNKKKTGTKKRYYGIIRDTGKKYIRGMNIIRKDTPEFLKDKLNILSELAVTGKLTLEHLQKVKKMIELQPLKSIGIVKAFSKRFDSYEKTQPQHLKGARWANDILGTNITHTDNPYLFYVISNCEEDIKPRLRNKAICILEEDLDKVKSHPELFELDYDTYFQKQVITPLLEFNLIPTVKSAIDAYLNSIS